MGDGGCQRAAGSVAGPDERFAREDERKAITAETPRRSVLRLGGLGLAISLAMGCVTYDLQHLQTRSRAFGGYETTTLGRLFEGEAARHPGHSGMNFLRYGRFAFRARLALADLAERSLDLQYYIWDPDITGRLLAERLVRAAERGVRVRVLLDDHSIRDRDTQLARLSGHPNIEIRAFNPYRDRSRWRDLFTEPSRVNRRSHNKIMVADNAATIVGGRNIADHYFGVHGDSNYRDLDVVAAGPVVRNVSGVFDAFWNSEFAVPYAAFTGHTPTPDEAADAIAEIRTRIAADPPPYPIDLDLEALRSQLEEERDAFVWAPVRVLYDDPEKMEDPDVRGIVDQVLSLIRNAGREVLVENAYFVPRERAVELAASVTERGVRVRVLTNSLASNDVAAVHSGYKEYRDDLLEAGVEIYELRPDSEAKRRWSALSSRSRAGLHTKTMVVDREHVVIGSYNFDPRSADINSECALQVDSAEFGARVGAFLDEGVRPENSYRVTLEDGDPRWTTWVDGETVEYETEPETSWWKRFTVSLMGLLPIQSQL